MLSAEETHFMLHPKVGQSGQRVWEFKTSSKATRDAWVVAFESEGAADK